jgi:hypothetical protein
MSLVGWVKGPQTLWERAAFTSDFFDIPSVFSDLSVASIDPLKRHTMVDRPVTSARGDFSFFNDPH